MQKKDLLKQLNNLKNEIKPDLEWKKSSREILFSQIKAQTSGHKDEKISWHVLFVKQFMVSAYKPLGAMILIFGIGLGAYITTVGATRNSLPGDLLYNFKLTAERVQVGLASNDEKKADLEIAFADRRLDEMKKLTEDNKADKKENVQVSLKKFQESMDNVKSSLAKLEQVDSKTALKLANKVDEKTTEYVNILKDQQIKAPELTGNTETADAITASKSTADKAIDVMVKEFESGNKDIALEDLKAKVNARIDVLVKNIETDKTDIDLIIANKIAAAKALEEKRIADEAAAKKAAEEAAKKVAEEKAAADNTVSVPASTTSDGKTDTANTPAETNTNINTNTNSNNATEVTEGTVAEGDQTVDVQPEEVLPTIEEIKDKPAEAERLLAKAREFLASNSISQAFDLIKQADEIMRLVNKVIKANEEFLVAPVVEVQPVDVPAVKEGT